MKFIRVIKSNEENKSENYHKFEEIVNSLEEPITINFDHDWIDVYIGSSMDFDYEFLIKNTNHIGKAIAEEAKNYDPEDTVREWLKEGPMTEEEKENVRKGCGDIKRILNLLAEKTKVIW